MSGLCGVLPRQPSQAVEVEALGAMAGALGGSDEERTWVEPASRVGFGLRGFPGFHTEVASREVGGATCALAFHGNLYSDGVPGPAAPDAGLEAGPADALLERFIRSGLEGLDRLRGEFAIAFWDGRDRSLWLATDRFRVHSLVFATLPDRLLFASRMRALLEHPAARRFTIDAEAVLDIVGSSIVPSPRTIFREVQKLPPGHLLVERGGSVEVRPYWDVDFTGHSPTPPEQLREEVRSALSDAVSVRLADDTARSREVGTFLSGGIDSSTVTGLLTRLGGAPVRAFSIGFGETGFDELSYARIAARSFGSVHTEYYVTPRDVGESLDMVADAFDEPFANASAVPTYFCARVAREHGLGVLYAGDGGDELFAGTERYATNRVFDPYDRLPRWTRAALSTGIRAAARLAPLPLVVKAGKYVRRAGLPAGERFISYGFWFVIPPAGFVAPDFLVQAPGYRPSVMSVWHHDHARATEELDRELYLDLKITISDNDLIKVMRASEHAGIAVRFPFLDRRVADVAVRVPARVRMRGRRLRSFFKDSYRDLLPPEILAKQKHGFGLPISLWLRTDPVLHERMRDLVLGSRSLGRGYFRQEALEDIVARHAVDPTPFYGTILWNLMVLELWQRRTLEGRAS